jgi:hypothetical protein
MAVQKAIRSEKALWNKELVLVELFDLGFRIRMKDGRRLDVGFQNVTNCLRSMNEIRVTAKGYANIGRDVCNIQILFENKDTAQYYYSYIAEHTRVKVSSEGSNRKSEAVRDDVPCYTIPAAMGLTVGTLYVYRTYLNFIVTEDCHHNKLQYADVAEVRKNFGNLRFILRDGRNMIIQIPKKSFIELYDYFCSVVKIPGGNQGTEKR